jgi:hypothetical protein
VIANDRYWYQAANEDVLFKIKLPLGLNIESLLMSSTDSDNNTNQNVHQQLNSLSSPSVSESYPHTASHLKWRLVYRKWKTIRQCGVGNSTFIPTYLQTTSQHGSQLRKKQFTHHMHTHTSLPLNPHVESSTSKESLYL